MVVFTGYPFRFVFYKLKLDHYHILAGYVTGAIHQSHAIRKQEEDRVCSYNLITIVTSYKPSNGALSGFISIFRLGRLPVQELATTAAHWRNCTVLALVEG